jgi:hypothetical protein
LTAPDRVTQFSGACFGFGKICPVKYKIAGVVSSSGILHVSFMAFSERFGAPTFLRRRRQWLNGHAEIELP